MVNSTFALWAFLNWALTISEALLSTSVCVNFPSAAVLFKASSALRSLISSRKVPSLSLVWVFSTGMLPIPQLTTLLKVWPSSLSLISVKTEAVVSSLSKTLPSRPSSDSLRKQWQWRWDSLRLPQIYDHCQHVVRFFRGGCFRKPRLLLCDPGIDYEIDYLR